MKNITKLSLVLIVCTASCLFSCGNKSKSNVVSEDEDSTEVVDSINTGSSIDSVLTQEQAKPVDPNINNRKDSVVAGLTKPVKQDSLLLSAVDTTAASNLVSTGGQFNPNHSVSGSKLICLTFDDGPSNKTTPKILDTMEKYGAHCTFFCVGKCITESTKHNLSRAESLGCEVANHTYSHPSLTKCNKQKQIEELNMTNDKILDAVGHYPIYFRPPYLACNSNVLKGLNLVCVSGYSSDDWVTSNSPSRIVENVMKYAKDGAIIVMHDLGANQRTPVALETLVPRLQEEGFTLVTVSELFSAKGKSPELEKTYTTVK